MAASKVHKTDGGYVVSKTLNFIVIFEELRRNLGLFFVPFVVLTKRFE